MSTVGEFDVDAIEDTDNLNQKMQIRAVNDARSKVRQVRNRAQEQIASAEPRSRPRVQQGGQRVYLQVAKSYALELAPLIAEHDEELWAETALLNGEISYTRSGGDDGKEIVGVEPDQYAVTIEGVEEWLATEFPLTAQFAVTYRDTAKGEEPVRRPQSWSPSFSQIDMVVLQLDNSRKDLGLFLEGPDEVPDESDEPFSP